MPRCRAAVIRHHLDRPARREPPVVQPAKCIAPQSPTREERAPPPLRGVAARADAGGSGDLQSRRWRRWRDDADGMPDGQCVENRRRRRRRERSRRGCAARSRVRRHVDDDDDDDDEDDDDDDDDADFDDSSEKLWIEGALSLPLRHRLPGCSCHRRGPGRFPRMRWRRRRRKGHRRRQQVEMPASSESGFEPHRMGGRDAPRHRVRHVRPPPAASAQRQ